MDSLCQYRKQYFYLFQPFKRQPDKMVKHTQTIRRLLPTNCLSVFDHFVGLEFKESKMYKTFYPQASVR